MDEIISIAAKHNLFVIEDAAEAHGALYKGKKAGSLGDVAAFSFYANKIITTGEGGMVITNDPKIAEKAKSKRNHCFSEERFVHKEIGFNYRMTNIQAAIGLAQLEKIESYISAKIKHAGIYNGYLAHIDGITLPPSVSYSKNVYWMYGILVDKNECGVSAKEMMRLLLDEGIETRSLFYPLNEQPAYQLKSNDLRFPMEKTTCKNAMHLWENGLYLPSSINLNEKDIQIICDSIKKIIKQFQ
jgi:perosamine synthetase